MPHGENTGGKLLSKTTTRQVKVSQDWLRVNTSHTLAQKGCATSSKAPWSAGLGREALPLLFCGRHRQVEDKRLD